MKRWMAGALAGLALAAALSGCGSGWNTDEAIVLDYCSTAVSVAQEEGCQANVTADDIRAYASQGSQNAKDAISDAINEQGGD
jgi:hypothetical protein